MDAVAPPSPWPACPNHPTCLAHALQAVPQEAVPTVISTPVKKRLALDLSKATVSSVASAAKLFSGGSAAPASPKRGAAGRDLLTTTRSFAEEE